MPKKKTEVKKSEINNLDVVKKAIKKKYGNVLEMMGNFDEYNKMKSISSGSLGLDIALGRGGFVRGRVYEVFGPPSGGKTTLAMSVIAESQKRELNCVFVDAEHSADPNLFEAMGVDTAKLLTIKAYIGDDNLDVLEMLIKTQKIDVAVVDSVSALIPKAEAEGKIGDDYIGTLARLMSKTTRKFVPILSESNTLLIFINQIRYKIGVYGDPRTTTGGEALNFYSTARIAVSGGESKTSRIVDDITGEVTGHITTFNVVKNKLAPPYRKAFIPLIYGVGYDNHKECLMLAEELGLVDKNGSWYFRKGEKLAQGEQNVINILKENDELYNEIRNEVTEVTGLKDLYEQNS